VDRWVADYRADHPKAGEWATGAGPVSHSEATQARIFRMAEQLRANFGWTSAEPLFPVLSTLDRAAAEQLAGGNGITPRHAARAALVTYGLLFGQVPGSVDAGWPLGFEPVASASVNQAIASLRQQGFDPIVIDGLDPAAYLWGLFELQQRQVACAEVIRVHHHRAQHPRCLVIVPNNSQQPIEGPRFAVAAMGGR
jgi:hypothetical protein